MTVNGSSIADAVTKFLHYPYVYGGTTPSGFDCSGLVLYVLTKLGVKGVPRTSEEQWAWATHISRSDLAPGDLVFAQFPGDNAPPGHVGIYVGNGKVISAEDPASGVGESTLDSWGSAIVGYGRVPGGTAGAQTATLDSATQNTGSSLLNPLAGLTAPFTEIASTFKDIDTVILDVLSPSFWLRIGAFLAGVFFLITGIWCLMHASDNSPIIPQNLPMVVPI